MSALQYPEFRRYFVGQAVSVVGTWMQSVAAAWLVLQLSHDSAFALAVFRPADIPNWASDAEPTDVDAAQIRHTDPGPLSVLSEREKEILALIGQGMTSAQIAKKLCRTIKTIEWHRSAIARKLHTKDRVALAQLAIQAGLCSPTFKVPMGKGRGRTAMAK